MKVTITKSDAEEKMGTATVSVTGAATVRGGEALKAALVTALADSGKVRLDVGGITEADASFFQLLHSARLTAGSIGKQLYLVAGSSGGEILQNATAAGFDSAGLFDEDSGNPLQKEEEL